MNAALIKSWLKTFVGAFIGFMLASGIPALDMTLGDAKAATSAAIGATLVVIYGWLDPNDTRYGVGSE